MSASAEYYDGLDDIDQDVTAAVFATLCGHAHRAMATASCALPESRQALLHTEISRRWAQLADAVENGLLPTLDADLTFPTVSEDVTT